MREYKDKYSFYQSTSFTPDEMALIYTKNLLKNPEALKNRKLLDKNSFKKNKQEIIGKMQKSTKTMQWHNSWGTCPEQLKDRLRNFIVTNRELPSNKNRGCGLHAAICRIYGNAVKGYFQLGLPIRRDSYYIFFNSDLNVKELKFDLHDMVDRERFFEFIINNSPLFKQNTI